MLNNFFAYYDGYNHTIYDIIKLIGFIIGAFFFKKLNTTSKTFFYLLCLTTVVEHYAYYVLLSGHNNSYIYNPFLLVQFSIIAFAFYKEILNKTIVILYLLFVLLFFSVFILKNTYRKELNTDLQSVEYIITIIFFFLMLITYFKKNDNFHLSQYPVFWIGTGWLIFSIASIVGFKFTDVIDKNSIWADIVEYTKEISNYILYAMFAVGFLSPQKSLADVKTNNENIAVA